MSAPEMFLEYVNALKWLVLAGGIIWLFRDPLDGLIRRIEKLVVKGPGETQMSLEASVGEDLARATDPVVPPPTTIKRLAAQENNSVDANESRATTRRVEVWASPDVYALTKCSPVQVDTFRRKIASLANLDYDEALMMFVPADSVRNIFDNVGWILESATPAIWGTTLWPGCSPDLRDTYASMIRTAGFALIMRNTVTGTTAKEFLNLVQVWGRNYNNFVQSAIRTLEMLPENAHVMLLTEDSRRSES
ncbi:hypothetical protein ABZ942_13410 [Nocardia sp. NPDC046473]|uniref:hypothetical protein n=1 Tax=Nocardia sp. NPDC046473 TaxID=3155733 RepID=UPI0033DDF943